MAGSGEHQSTIVLVLDGPIAASAVAGLCERVRTLLDGGDTEVVICDVGALTEPCAVTIDALARLQLTARRSGGSVRLRNASKELRGLLALLGLGDVLPSSDRDPVDPHTS